MELSNQLDELYEQRQNALTANYQARLAQLRADFEPYSQTAHSELADHEKLVTEYSPNLTRARSDVEKLYNMGYRTRLEILSAAADQLAGLLSDRTPAAIRSAIKAVNGLDPESPSCPSETRRLKKTLGDIQGEPGG